MGVSIFPDRDIFVILGVCSTMKTSLFSLVLCLMTVCVLPGAAQEDTRYRRYRIPSPVIQYHLFFMSTEGHKWWRIVQTVSPGGPYYEVLVSEGSPDDPVELTISSPHYGSVGHGETSYYHLRASKRGAGVLRSGLDLQRLARIQRGQ